MTISESGSVTGLHRYQARHGLKEAPGGLHLARLTFSKYTSIPTLQTTASLLHEDAP